MIKKTRGGDGDIDKIVGKRIRMAREARGVTMEELGKSVGLVYQQIQKYEKAQSRITVSRLTDIANTLQVPITDLLPIQDMKSQNLETLAEITVERDSLREKLNQIKKLIGE